MKKTFRRLQYIVLLAACATICSPAAIAQTSSTEQHAGVQRVFDSNVFGIGLYASLCSGTGISFRQHFAYTPLAYQVTVGPWKTSKLSIFAAGVEIQYDLSVADLNRLFAVAGFGYYYWGENHNERSSPSRFGIGAGYDLALSKSFTATFNLMVTSFQPDGTLLPLPSIGFHTYFK